MTFVSYWREHGWFRSAVAVSGVVLFFLIAIIYIGHYYQTRIANTQMNEFCRELAESIVGSITHSLSVGNNDAVREQFKKLEKRLPGTDVFVYDFTGKIAFSTESGKVGTSFYDYLDDEALVEMSRRMIREDHSEKSFEKEISNDLYKGIVIPSLNEPSCYHCHGKSRAVLGGTAVMVNTNDTRDIIKNSRNISLITGAVAIIAVVCLIYFIFARMASRITVSVDSIRETSETAAGSAESLKQTTKAMREHAHKGNDIAVSVSTGAREVTEHISNIASASEEVGARINDVNSNSERVSEEIDLVNSNLSEVSAGMESVAAAAEQMSTSVDSVATAMEQMYASQHEVAKNSGRCATMTNTATADAAKTSEIVNDLGRAAGEIQSVVDLINSIASQTNLLALNAAIEAAGAGEAGKGFAVVANEVKELAKQTSGAIEDIRTKVEGMQENTKRAIEAIEAITGVITEIDDSMSSIASAVEEQTATTNEVSENISESAESAGTVAENINQAAEKVKAVSGSMDKIASFERDVSKSLREITVTAGEITKDVASSSEGTRQVSGKIDKLAAIYSDNVKMCDGQKSKAEEMDRIAGKLRQEMERFKI